MNGLILDVHQVYPLNHPGSVYNLTGCPDFSDKEFLLIQAGEVMLVGGSLKGSSAAGLKDSSKIRDCL